MVAENALQLTDQTFQEVISFPGVTLVDFWAAWCGPCRAMAPHIETLAVKYKDNAQVNIAQMDIEAEPETSQALRILSIPCFKYFVNGKEVDQVVGVNPIQELEAHIQKALNALTPATT